VRNLQGDRPSAEFWERQREAAGNWAANARSTIRAAKLNYARLGTLESLKFYQRMQGQYCGMISAADLAVARCNAELALMGQLELSNTCKVVSEIAGLDERCGGR
jgi:hypothetical protein